MVAILDRLTDPDVPAASKTDIVTPGFSPDEAQKLDDRLNRMRRPALPFHFVVTDIQPAPNNFAGATVASVGNPRQSTFPKPIVLVEQGGHWLITHDTALDKFESLYTDPGRRTHCSVVRSHGMNWTKFSIAITLAAALIASPATAYADCGDPDQPPCTGPVPTVDDVVGIFNGLTDPDIPAANKTNIVTPGFSPDEAGTIDDHLNRMRGPALPLHFVVTDIQPALNGFAGATLATEEPLASTATPDR